MFVLRILDSEGWLVPYLDSNLEDNRRQKISLKPGREPVYSTRGVVCSISPQASSVGINILSSGGNAFDAIVAMALVEGVTTSVGCGLGGEVFGLFYEAVPGKVWGMTASGKAPSRANRNWFTDRGYKSIPLTGPLSAAIPGEIDALQEITDKFGTMSFRDLIEPAITYAEDGFPISRFYSGAFKAMNDKLDIYESTSSIFTNEGLPFREGQIIRQPELSKTLKLVSENGAREFYEGDLAERILKSMLDDGGLYSLKDFRSHQTVWYDSPISTSYRGRDIVETSLPSQGFMVLEMLNILEAYDFNEMGLYSSELCHLMVEAKKLAFADRNTYMGDPEFVVAPIDEMISKEYAAQRRREIDCSQVMNSPSAGILGLPLTGDDTSYLCAVDGMGNAVSLIHSLSMGFGSGFVAGDTGVLLNNRIGRGFNLIDGHPNVIEPLKKTMHTLNAYLVLEKGKPVLVGGTPGGDGQIPWNVQTITNAIDFGMNPQQAVDAPRWTHTPGTDPATINQEPFLDLDVGMPADIEEALAGLGHNVAVNDSGSFGGSAKMIKINQESGVISGGSDRRSDGLSSAL